MAKKSLIIWLGIIVLTGIIFIVSLLLVRQQLEQEWEQKQEYEKLEQELGQQPEWNGDLLEWKRLLLEWDEWTLRRNEIAFEQELSEWRLVEQDLNLEFERGAEEWLVFEQEIEKRLELYPKRPENERNPELQQKWEDLGSFRRNLEQESESSMEKFLQSEWRGELILGLLRYRQSQLEEQRSTLEQKQAQLEQELSKQRPE